MDCRQHQDQDSQKDQPESAFPFFIPVSSSHRLETSDSFYNFINNFLNGFFDVFRIDHIRKRFFLFSNSPSCEGIGIPVYFLMDRSVSQGVSSAAMPSAQKQHQGIYKDALY